MNTKLRINGAQAMLTMWRAVPFFVTAQMPLCPQSTATLRLWKGLPGQQDPLGLPHCSVPSQPSALNYSALRGVLLCIVFHTIMVSSPNLGSLESVLNPVFSFHVILSFSLEFISMLPGSTVSVPTSGPHLSLSNPMRTLGIQAM